MLDPRIVKQIISAWQTDESHPHRGRRTCPLPPLEALQEFINTTFLATLRDEEGRQVWFSVALVMEGDLQSQEEKKTLALMRLRSPSDFSAASLVKLAGAFDPKSTTIVVMWEEALQKFVYRGITFHAPGLNRFTEVPVNLEGGTIPRPDFFTVIAKGRGAVAFARGNSLIGTLQAGYFVAATPTPFTSSSLGQYVDAAIKQDSLFASHGEQYLRYARDAVDILLSEAAMRGHGGTIILLSCRVTPDSGLFASKYELAGSYGLRKTLDLCIQNRKAGELDIAYRKLANETIQRLAQLAAVDGALILTFDFEVVTFGATLTAPRSTLIPIIGPDGFGQKANVPFQINRYGTRHRSAFDFVSAQSGAIAFVVSQDGPIRALRRENDTTVYVWPDCTASMFV